MQIIGKHEDLRKIQTDQAHENINSRHLTCADSNNCSQITTHDYLDVETYRHNPSHACIHYFHPAHTNNRTLNAGASDTNPTRQPHHHHWRACGTSLKKYQPHYKKDISSVKGAFNSFNYTIHRPTSPALQCLRR
jgi:hypothetical protein